MGIKKAFNKMMANIVNNLSQGEIDRTGVEHIVTDGMPQILRQSAADGAVLLKNDCRLPTALAFRFSADAAMIISLSATARAAMSTIPIVSA